MLGLYKTQKVSVHSKCNCQEVVKHSKEQNGGDPLSRDKKVRGEQLHPPRLSLGLALPSCTSWLDSIRITGAWCPDPLSTARVRRTLWLTAFKAAEMSKSINWVTFCLFFSSKFVHPGNYKKFLSQN